MGGVLQAAPLSMPGPGGWQRAFWKLRDQPAVLGSPVAALLPPHAVLGDWHYQVLSDEHAREMCLRFADMECKLGEIDRARAIYSFCSQICDPRVGMSPGQVGEQGEAAAELASSYTGIPTLHRQLGPSGKHGRTSRYGMATRTPSGRCCVSAEVCRPLTTHRSTSWPRRCSRCRAVLQALVSSCSTLHPGWVHPGATHSPVSGPVGPASALYPALTSWNWEQQVQLFTSLLETGNSLRAGASGTGGGSSAHGVAVEPSTVSDAPSHFPSVRPCPRAEWHG